MMGGFGAFGLQQVLAKSIEINISHKKHSFVSDSSETEIYRSFKPF